MNRPNLNFFARIAVPFAISALKNAVYLIKIDSVKKFLKDCILDIIEDIADLLTDDDPQNAEQIAIYFKNNWKGITKKHLVFLGELCREQGAPAEITNAIENAVFAFKK